MNNPYCASFEEVRDLYVTYMEAEARKNYDEGTNGLTREEIKKQLDTQTGRLIEGIRNFIKKMTTQTEFVEFIAALQLADFYFPNENKDICFEIKRGVKPESIKTYGDLTGSFEDYTHIDCEVRATNNSISFQIKRDGSDRTPVGFATWLNAKIFKKYGEMSGTALVVFLGVPKDNRVVALDKYYEEFTKNCVDNISFDSVSILYNDNDSGHLVLHELFPKHKRTMIEANLAMARIKGEV